MKRKYVNSRGKRVIMTCKHCGQEFETLSLKAEKGKELFCSKDCYTSYRREHSTNLKERNILYQKKTKYGLNESEYKEMFLKQENKCLICETSFEDTKAFVDHNHSTGRVRGLLCTKCNTLLGMCNDNPNILRKAIEYLNKF